VSAGQAAASCTLTPGGAVTDVPVSRKYSVTYTFNTEATNAKLAIPYAVALNGTVLPEHEEMPRSLGGDRKIKLVVPAGTKVELYLNSDARQGFRTQPVYGVEVGARDVEVNIKEHLGRSNTETGKLSARACIMTAEGKRIDRCNATLTGDIWMKISHQYTKDEACKIIPANTDPIIHAAVVSIYAPLTSRSLAITFPATGANPAQSIKMTFDEQPSVDANTSYCPLLSHVLTRTHPNCYLALITEARAAGITKLCVNSAWRSSFGSIVHRAGLGLDVYYIESGSTQLSIERKALISSEQSEGRNVTKKEKELFDEMTKKKLEEKARRDEVERLTRTTKQSAAPLSEEVNAARLAADNARLASSEAEQEWTRQLLMTEPALMKSFRSRLAAREDVVQIIDPWYIDLKTKDKIPGKPNEQVPGVEKDHNNHLHITIDEPKILGVQDRKGR